jgi:hypothetical protein
VGAGWLQYRAGNKRQPAAYFVTIPAAVSALPDGACDESPQEYRSNNASLPQQLRQESGENPAGKRQESGENPAPFSPSPSPSPNPKDNQYMPDKSGECLPVEPVEPAMFEVFWNDYAKKRDRAAVVRYWNRMSAEHRHLAYDGVLRYVASNPDPQYRKDPIRYLKNKSWEDEAITHEPGKAQTVEQAAKECPHAPGSYEAMDWWVMNYPWFIPGCDVPNPNKVSA